MNLTSSPTLHLQMLDGVCLSLMDAVGRMQELEKGTVVVTLGRALSNRRWQVVQEQRRRMSYGPALVVIHVLT